MREFRAASSADQGAYGDIFSAIGSAPFHCFLLYTTARISHDFDLRCKLLRPRPLSAQK